MASSKLPGQVAMDKYFRFWFHLSHVSHVTRGLAADLRRCLANGRRVQRVREYALLRLAVLSVLRKGKGKVWVVAESSLA